MLALACLPQLFRGVDINGGHVATRLSRKPCSLSAAHEEAGWDLIIVFASLRQPINLEILLGTGWKPC
jgi:hypothetical protein